MFAIQTTYSTTFMELTEKNKQKIQDAIEHHKTWVTLLENIQTGDLNMCQVARMTEQHHNFPQALRHNFNKLDADFLLEYLRSHESGMTKLVRALIGLPQDQLFYLDEKAEQSFLEHMKHVLYPREMEILFHHFGINGYTVETLEQLAKRYLVTRERIRQIESKALRKLRKPQNLIYLFPKEGKQYMKALHELKEMEQLKVVYQKRIEATIGQVHAYSYLKALGEEPDFDVNVWKGVPVIDANFNVRATHVLGQHRCRTIYDVMQLTEDQIMAWPNAGVGTVKNIRETLAKFNLKLANE